MIFSDILDTFYTSSCVWVVFAWILITSGSVTLILQHYHCIICKRGSENWKKLCNNTVKGKMLKGSKKYTTQKSDFIFNILLIIHYICPFEEIFKLLNICSLKDRALFLPMPSRTGVNL